MSEDSTSSGFVYVKSEEKSSNLSSSSSTLQVKPKRILIIGAGLVGSLASILFSQRGFDVTVIEKRSGIYIKKFMNVLLTLMFY